jgi:P2-related tail formation protein
MVQPERPQMAIYYGACALRAVQRRLQTLRIRHNLLFSQGITNFASAPQFTFKRTLSVFTARSDINLYIELKFLVVLIVVKEVKFFTNKTDNIHINLTLRQVRENILAVEKQ